MNSPPAIAEIAWSYAYAPLKYRKLFPAPDPEKYAAIVWQRRLASVWQMEWIIPNGKWWGLWHEEASHVIDEYTTVFLLIENVKS